MRRPAPAAPRQTKLQPARRHVDAALQHVGSRASTDSISQTQAPHCSPSTASVSSCAPSLRGGDVAGEVPALGGVRARRAQRRVEHALRVVAAETERLDDFEGGGAAGAAEAAAGGAGWPQWTQGVASPTRTSAASRERAVLHGPRPLSREAGEGWGGGKRHRTMIRRVAAMSLAADGCRQRQVPLPWHHQRRVGDIAARQSVSWNTSRRVSTAPSGRSADAAIAAPRSGEPSRSASATSTWPAASVRASIGPAQTGLALRLFQHAVVVVAQIKALVAAALPGKLCSAAYTMAVLTAIDHAHRDDDQPREQAPQRRAALRCAVRTATESSVCGSSRPHEHRVIDASASPVCALRSDEVDRLRSVDQCVRVGHSPARGRCRHCRP